LIAVLWFSSTKEEEEEEEEEFIRGFVVLIDREEE
jgi:hypothetical protein